MSDSAYQKLKKQNGEAFARTLRDHHNGLLDIPNIDLIVRHAGRDATALLPYLMRLLAVNDDAPPAQPEDPFVLLDRAGYRAFHADTLEKQNSIKRYFAKGELLCTFNDAARHRNYHIVHAVRKDADTLKRAAFKDREERQDEYGTSVISIQMLKTGGFISIKNRYNHTVPACDNTFGSNPNNIIDGLSAALRSHFNVDFSVGQSELPDGYILVGTQIFKYHTERNNIYYGDQAWAHDGQIHSVDRSRGDALFDWYLFNNKTKTMKKIDTVVLDSFADDFNRDYGGERGLCVDKSGNLTLNGDILIGAEKSQIKTLYLPALTAMGFGCLKRTDALVRFEAPALTTMEENSLSESLTLTHFTALRLTTMGDNCLRFVPELTHFEAPTLNTMGNSCFKGASELTHFEAPALTQMGSLCFLWASSLKSFKAPALEVMNNHSLRANRALTHFEASANIVMGENCLRDARPSIKYQRYLPRWTTATLRAVGL